MAEVAIEAVSSAVDRGGADFANHPRRRVVVLRPTGAGKTTTLRLVAGLEEPDAGMRIGGRKVNGEPPARATWPSCSSNTLYASQRVRQHRLPPRSPARRMPELHVAAKVREIARPLQIEDKLDIAPRIYQVARCSASIGACAVRRPAIYLMDEPLSSLDAKLRGLRIELKHPGRSGTRSHMSPMTRSRQ